MRFLDQGKSRLGLTLIDIVIEKTDERNKASGIFWV